MTRVYVLYNQLFSLENVCVSNESLTMVILLLLVYNGSLLALYTYCYVKKIYKAIVQQKTVSWHWLTRLKMQKLFLIPLFEAGRVFYEEFSDLSSRKGNKMLKKSRLSNTVMLYLEIMDYLSAKFARKCVVFLICKLFHIFCNTL